MNQEILAIKIKALADCRDMWKWLADNPKEEKDNYFSVHNLEDVAGDCYLCEFTNTRGLASHKCSEACPIFFVWPNGCSSHPSPYYDWSVATTDDKKSMSACRIVEACEKALEEIYHG